MICVAKQNSSYYFYIQRVQGGGENYLKSKHTEMSVGPSGKVIFSYAIRAIPDK